LFIFVATLASAILNFSILCVFSTSIVCVPWKFV
jgi:hypothetical protein